MSGGSLQLRMFRRAIREGKTLMTACAESGLSLAEAKLTIAADAANPPPDDAYELIGSARKEDDMARTAKKQQEVEEIGKPDFERAVSIYRNDIKPAQARVGEYAQEQSTAYKEIKKGCNVHPGAAKLAFKLDAMEDTKRDDFLRSLKGLMSALNIGLSADLVDKAEGEDDEDVIPVKASSRPSLMPVH
ncbi:hypothetical protein [Sphingobium fluviale]|uniref:Uncharacterized protein n=1 Tax=Sphingobium fluviale TaxID=2506423 RepID=A0A4Q1KJX3_9SPHN|nr:hypothetical protein [Sphingobium fluviale]RXR28934.1 hypothetical protein EQG66_07605 [Sphingobium fluviale]